MESSGESHRCSTLSWNRYFGFRIQISGFKEDIDPLFLSNSRNICQGVSMPFQSFEDMNVWQEARSLTKEIGVVCSSIHKRKDWVWTDQISKAALSIMANIAEGNDAQTNAEFIQFLGYAKRSATEVRSHLYYGLDREYFSLQTFEKLANAARSIAKQLAGLIAYLRKHSTTLRNDPAFAVWNLKFEI